MKLTPRRLLFAVVVVIVGCIPAIALAQSPFRDYRDAAGDQYGTTTTTTTTTPSTTTTVTETTTTPGSTVAGASTGTPTPLTSPTTAAGGTAAAGGSGGSGAGAGGGAADSGSGSAPSKVAADSAGNEPASDGAGNAPATAAGGGGGAGAGAGFGIGGAYAWIALSPPRYDVFQNVFDTLGKPAYLAAMYEPVPVDVLKQITDGTQWQGASTDMAKLAEFAQALGHSIVEGGPLAKADLPKLADLPHDGFDIDQVIKPISGLVFTHRDVPLPSGQDTLRNTLIHNMIAGMRGVQIPTTKKGEKLVIPIVGTEDSDTTPSTIPWFKALHVSTVDDVDLPDGKHSLARVMEGVKGHFGIKPTATDGKLAKVPDSAGPLLFRPSSSYTPGELIRDGGNGGVNIGMLLLLGLVSSAMLVAIAERKTRGLRRRGRAAA